MFIGITGKNETAKLQKKFGLALRPFISEKVTTNLGYKGGNFSTKVNYSADLNIWWFLGVENKGKRYWNAFGIGYPAAQSSIGTEINYPLEGVNFRVAAHWTVDENNKHYLFHSGKIGGGKKGIGQSTFRESYRGTFYDIDIGGYLRNAALIGEIEDSNFGSQVAHFVYEVARIKGYDPDKQAKRPVHSFSEEFDGSKIYTLPYRVKANANHGLVVNSLYTELVLLGKQVASNGSTGRIDIYTYDKNGKVLQLFEVKSSLSLQAVYTAIGQLMAYSFPIKPLPALVFVCPSGFPKKVVALFESLNITILFFKWKRNKPEFENLKKIAV